MSLGQLIEEVRKYPCLWNKSKEEYRNENMRDNAWWRISGELEKTGTYIFNFNFYFKHICRSKAIITTYSKCVSAALVI